MNTMEFEDMKKIWDSQSNQTLYAINDNALWKRIEAKKQTTQHITNVTELVNIIVNVGASAFTLYTNFTMEKKSISLYVMAGWMLFTATYVLVNRFQRQKAALQFDRTMLGDLDNAIATATYQIRLALILRLNIIPMAALITLTLWEGGKSPWFLIGFLVAMSFAYFISSRDHKTHVRRKRELESLKQNLSNG